MNGIVSEAIYPAISKDLNNIPCRVFYFDGINLDMDRDIGIFMEIVRGYMSRKKVNRRYPDIFRESWPFIEYRDSIHIMKLIEYQSLMCFKE